VARGPQRGQSSVRALLYYVHLDCRE